MHALVDTIENLVTALAVAAFAHFGVALKDAPPAPHASAGRVQVSLAAPAGGHRNRVPCPLGQGIHSA